MVTSRFKRALVVVSVMSMAAFAPAAWAAKVSAVSPSGVAPEVRQISVRFSEAVVPLGDPRLPAPFTLSCGASTPAGDARWLNAAQWVFDLREPLAAGSNCVLLPTPGWKPLVGTAPAALEGNTEFRFSTGAPTVVQVQPYSGSAVEEDQHFLLRTNGAVDLASVQKNAWCEVEGLGDRIGLKLVQGAVREQLLKERRISANTERWLLVVCERPLPAEARMRIVWGAGIASAQQPSLVTTAARQFPWKVRARFTAEFSCERERAAAPCLPLRPMSLRFSAPVPRALALAARLLPPQGKNIEASADAQERGDMLSEVRFAAPLPESSKLKLTLPADLRDETGRSLANASTFPLEVSTGGMPPLAKFAAAPFGIVEAGPEAMLPLTLRHVQADLQGASTGGSVRLRSFDARSTDLELLRWIAKLSQYHESELSAKEAGRPQSEWTVIEREPDERGRTRDVKRERRIATRELSLLKDDAQARRSELPQLSGSPPRATEVIGIPLPTRAYHVVEIESRVLGHALLSAKAPMYVRTGVLATNLGVHFKRGRGASLVWVTTLDRGRPVPNARVAVNDCRGQVMWSGNTDAMGIARIERELDDDGRNCLSSAGLFVTARAADAQGQQELSFVFSQWNRGIEPWRFNLPTANTSAPGNERIAHTVFDRTLLRAGEVLSMKHFWREQTLAGLAMPAADNLPQTAVLTHIGSGVEVKLPLAWRAGARSAESRWEIPRNAKLGLYDVALLAGSKRWGSGQVRVEEFRVPLVDARLSGPASPTGPLIAPAQLQLAAQLNVMAGGPLARAPLRLSALLQEQSPNFAGHEDFSFAPPQRATAAGAGNEESGEAPDDKPARLVADKLAASTDAQGAASITLPALPALEAPAVLTAELSFTDPNGEVQTVSQRLRLWPSAVVVGIRALRWAGASTREPARYDVIVLDAQGKPVPGRAVEVVGRVKQNFSTRKRIVGGFYAYDSSSQTRELGVLCKGQSDSRGRVSCESSLTDTGEIELIARAKDDAQRLSQAAASLWVTGDEDSWFAQGQDDRIDVLPEKRELNPGDTARLQVRMPFREATALVTVEREGVVDARVVTLRGSQPVLELPIPKDAKDASWAPNVMVSVLVLRGRIREVPWTSFFRWGWREPVEWWRAFRYEGRDWRAPTALVDLAKPAYRLGVAELKVGLGVHRLEVQVTPERSTYGVRETVRTTVSVRQGGKPAANAEVAFAAVDEGLLALRPNDSWNLLEGLMRRRAWGVETATAQGEIIGRRHYGRKAMAPGGDGGANPTRELFDTLLLWRGTVVLDANGQASIDVPLNDSLTSFRLVAVADVGADRFGTGSASVRVTQELQTFSGLPTLVRDGDRFEATLTLRNSTSRAMNVKASLVGQARGATGMAGFASDSTPPNVSITLPDQTVALAAGAAAELRWPVELPAKVERIEWTASAEETGGRARDRIKVMQTVQSAVPLRVWQATLAPLDAPLSMPLAPPADALAGQGANAAKLGGVQVQLQRQLSGALPGLRRYFENYPYSCLEQKTSRAIALRDPGRWKSLTSELAGYLDNDGLASYFPPRAEDAARGSDRLTAYLLATAHEAGWAWPEAERERMLQGLAAFVEGRLTRSFNAPRADLDVRKLAALEALARHGRVQPRMLGSLALSPAAVALWPTSALLDWWSILRRVDALPERTARLAEVQNLLRSRLTVGGTTLRFSSEDSDSWWWLMEAPDANAARLLLAAVSAPEWKDEVPRLVVGHLARQRAGAWATTTSNLWSVLALERFAANFESAPVAGRTLLRWGGSARQMDWNVSADPAAQQLPWPSTAAPLSATHEGSGRPWITVQALAAVPLKAPLFAGYRVSRSLSAVERKTPDVWSRGDVLRVRLEIEAAADMAWVVINDPLPAGAAHLGTGLGRDSAMAVRGERRDGSGWLAFEERAQDAYRAYYEWLPRGKHVVEYTLRLNAAGRFVLPPSRVEAMYAPETFGELPGITLEVRQ
jgi:alpha-2-macroglobulin